MKIKNRDSFKVRIFKNLKLAGHLIRLNKIIAHKLVLWKPTHARARICRKTITYVNKLNEDSGLDEIN